MINIIKYTKKNKGFSILEVLFAIVILSFSLSVIFVLLNNMFKVVAKVKELSFHIEKTPILFSSTSPLMHKKNIENYKSEFFNIPEYSKKELLNTEDCQHFTTTFIASLERNENKVATQYFSNIIFIPLKKNQKVQNES
jgi:prepilin-type N-terminal cleavage/methylation domain-containing protein